MSKTIPLRTKYLPITLDKVTKSKYFKYYKEFSNPENEELYALSLGAGNLYAILRDLYPLSIKNEWRDEHGYFVQITQEQAKVLLKINSKGRDTIIKLFKELEEIGLIYRKKNVGYTDNIYVMDFDKKVTDENCE